MAYCTPQVGLLQRVPLESYLPACSSCMLQILIPRQECVSIFNQIPNRCIEA